MKLLSLFILSLVGLSPVFSQSKIVVINADTLRAMLVKKHKVDSIGLAAKVHLQNEFSRGLEALKLEIARLDKICFTPTSYENKMQELKQEHGALMAFEKVITDSLPVMRKGLLAHFEEIIRSEAQVFMTENRCDVVASTRDLLFFEPEIDRTEEFYIRLTNQPRRAEFEKITNEYATSLNALMKN